MYNVSKNNSFKVHNGCSLWQVFFPPSDVPGIQSSILCFYHNLVDHCVHLHQSRGKNGKAQTVLHGVAFYAEYLEIMLIIASHILLARAQNPTCHSPSAEEKKEKRKKKKKTGKYCWPSCPRKWWNNVGELLWQLLPQHELCISATSEGRCRWGEINLSFPGGASGKESSC